MRTFECDSQKTDLIDGSHGWIVRIWNGTNIVSLYEIPLHGGEQFFVRNFKTPADAVIYAESNIH